MSATPEDYQDDLDHITNLVGQLRGNQRDEVIEALDDDRDGVRTLAEKIGTTDGLDAPAAVFIAAIRRGEYRASGGGKTQRLKPRVAFRAFFDERREWLRDQTDLDENRIAEAAISYAVSSFSARSPIVDDRTVKILAHDTGETVLTLEDELRVELNQNPRPSTTPEQRYETMLAWKRIAESLHDPRIAAMHGALMEQFAIPHEPTHAEAGDARQALIAEIDALGVAPRSLVKVEEVEGFTTIGEALSGVRET